jgi:hypothetical protein
MSDQPRTKGQSISKSGVFPRTVQEPETRREAVKPSQLPEMRDDGATTGIFPIVTEGRDPSAEGDEDRVTAG